MYLQLVSKLFNEQLIRSLYTYMIAEVVWNYKYNPSSYLQGKHVFM